MENSQTNFCTQDNKDTGNAQSSDGLASQSCSSWGIHTGGAELTASLWIASVVVLRVRASARHAEGDDILGRCLISTEAPKKQEIRCSARRKIEAVLSWGTRLFSHPNTNASLSVSKVTCLPIRMVGHQRKGRMRAMASKVEDLHP
jgi:hypothetical protein